MNSGFGRTTRSRTRQRCHHRHLLMWFVSAFYIHSIYQPSLVVYALSSRSFQELSSKRRGDQYYFQERRQNNIFQPVRIPPTNSPRTWRSQTALCSVRSASTILPTIISRISPSASTIAAALALGASATLGQLADQKLRNSGILVTLIVAASLSNMIPVIPLHHVLYDKCWTWILPASLTFLLLGYKTNNNTGSALSININDNKSSPGTISQAILRVAGPFLFATLGSILGCFLAYQSGLAKIIMSEASRRATVSCLAASYVGGSVNLFATAKIVQAPPSLLSAMATADLIVMALYFSILSNALQWEWLRKLYYENCGDDGDTPTEDQTNESMPSVSVVKNEQESLQLRIQPLFSLLTVTAMIVSLANSVESYLSRWIPGMACGVIAIVAPLIGKKAVFSDNLANVLSDICFLLFFASIGVGVNLQATLWELGPSCLGLATMALVIHLGVTFFGSFLLCRVWPGRQQLTTRLEDVMIASNAAIGGPATAAAFCNRLVDTQSDKDLLVGRTVAATVWGVVGYAIGTLVGVSLFRHLGR